MNSHQESNNNNELIINELLNLQIGDAADTKSMVTFKALILKGLTQLVKEKPMGEEAITFLGEWLLKNNPNQPTIVFTDND
jgi:hypothetical protein